MTVASKLVEIHAQRKAAKNHLHRAISQLLLAGGSLMLFGLLMYMSASGPDYIRDVLKVWLGLTTIASAVLAGMNLKDYSLIKK